MKTNLFGRYAIISVFVLMLSGVGFSSCCACRQGSPKIGELENATWRLIELKLNPIEDSRITVRFDGTTKMIYGEAPCNNFFASYSLTTEKDNIVVGAVGATRKACPEMDLEMEFTGVLGSVVRVKTEGDHLLMIDGQGALVAVLIAVKDPVVGSAEVTGAGVGVK